MTAFWIYLVFFIAIALFVWAFYLVAKIHTYKFKEYSSHIRPVTRIVGLVLLMLTCIGFYAVMRELRTGTSSVTTIQTSNIQETY